MGGRYLRAVTSPTGVGDGTSGPPPRSDEDPDERLNRELIELLNELRVMLPGVHAIKEVAAELGNTPAVARASYVDPRLLDRYEEGVTIDSTIVRGDAPRERGDDEGLERSSRDVVEAAVLELLGDGRSERAAA